MAQLCRVLVQYKLSRITTDVTFSSIVWKNPWITQISSTEFNWSSGSRSIHEGKEPTKEAELLRDQLIEAKERMKMYADRKRVEREFQVGDYVYLRLQPYRQSTISLRINLKLAPRFYGPYEVIQKIGRVAYKLQLPPEAKVHPVFHVSQLKKKVGQKDITSPSLPPVGLEGQFLVEPVAILDRRMIKRGNVAVVQVLIQWSSSMPTDATWEEWSDIARRFPEFNLETRFVEGGGNVTNEGRTRS